MRTEDLVVPRGRGEEFFRAVVRPERRGGVMSIKLDLPKVTDLRPRLTVIGIGGAGCNAVNNMIAAGLSGVEFVVANTDAQALAASSAEHRLQLGVNLTEGLGAGARPEIGEAAAEEALDDIRAQISGSHMVFLAAGMGGGTGTGAASVIARISRELGILTVGVVTKPFLFEGSRRMRVAEAGIEQLRDCVDTLIVIPNQNLFRIANEKTTFSEAFLLADQVLYSGVACIIDLILKEGLINLDFADVRAILSGMGTAMMGTGEAEGERRAILAAEEAIANPLLDDVTLKGAQGLLLSITGGPELTLYEVDEAASRVRQEVDPEANIIVGATFDDTLGDSVRVSIVASGMERQLQNGSSTGQSTGSGFGPGSMMPNRGGASSGGMGSMAGPASDAGPSHPPAPAAPAEQQGGGGFIPNVQPDAPAHGSLLAGVEGKPADHGAMAPPPVPGQDETDLQRKLADAMQYRDGHPPQDGRGIGDGVLPTYDGHAGEHNSQYETWQAPGDVLIESERPQLTPPPAPMPPAAEQASNDDPYAGVTGDFQPMPPSEIRRPGRRMPDVGDFPQVGQREYHAKKSEDDGGDGHQGQQRSRKPSFFERLTGFARTQGDSEGHEGESDERSMSTQSRRENRGGSRGGEGRDGGSSDERADAPQAPELPVFFNRGQR